TGEGQKRQEWGIATVRINKRTHACPKCLPFVGKVLIDDVWSGGKADGVHMTMSYAMSKGLYHPNCRDIHTTYFDGISREPVPYTQEEVDAVAEDYRREQETNYAKHQAEKYDRLSKHSLDKDNQKKYGVLAEKWEEKVSQEITEVRELPKFTSEKTIDEAEEFAKQFVDVSQLSCQEHHTELGTFKKRIYADENMRVEYQTNLKDKFSHGRKDAQKLFNKYVPSDSVVRWDYEDIAKYEDGKIYMHYGADSRNERGIGATWFHEHGHLIDDKLGNISNDKNFAKILEKDANTYRVQYGKKYKLNTYDKVDRAISNELSEMRKHSAVSDLFEGITKGNIRGVAGHAKIKNGELDLTYWEKEGMLTSEAFAHMFEAQFDETRYNEMKKYFPNALKYFEEMIGGVV
ncbi:MAG: phage minor capsid protein, partial [Lachnospiraceae bacterium]